MNSTKKTRKDQAEATKLHIFNTALRLLEGRDFEQIKVRDIVHAAGVSVGTYYHYYTSKMDVYYETYHIFDEYFEETVQPLLVHESINDRVLCLFDHYAKYCSEITGLSLTSILFNPTNKHFERKTDKGILKILPKLMEDGMLRKEFRPDDSPENMARFFIISVRGLVYHWCICDGSYDLGVALRQYVEKLLRCYSIK